MLEDNDIFLVPVTRADTENIVRWRNQPSVRQYFICQDLFTPESHEHWLETMVDTGKVVQFIIYVKAENRPIGAVYLRDIDRVNQKAEYGIFIGEEQYLGKGIGSAAAKLVLAYAFDELKLHKIMLRVFASNERAIASYEKVGFVQEGYFKDEVLIDGKYRDLIFMAKIAPES